MDPLRDWISSYSYHLKVKLFVFLLTRFRIKGLSGSVLRYHVLHKVITRIVIASRAHVCHSDEEIINEKVIQFVINYRMGASDRSLPMSIEVCHSFTELALVWQFIYLLEICFIFIKLVEVVVLTRQLSFQILPGWFLRNF